MALAEDGEGEWVAVGKEGQAAAVAQEVRSLEDEVRRARESEAIALAAQLHSEKVMGAAFEQLSAEAAAAKLEKSKS